MKAFVIFHLNIHDLDAFGAYARAVGPTLTPFGGAVALRGKNAQVLAGEHDRSIVGILSFPDRDAAHGWYGSDAYQALVPQRDAAADVVAIGFDAIE